MLWWFVVKGWTTIIMSCLECLPGGYHEWIAKQTQMICTTSTPYTADKYFCPSPKKCLSHGQNRAQCLRYNKLLQIVTWNMWYLFLCLPLSAKYLSNTTFRTILACQMNVAREATKRSFLPNSAFWTKKKQLCQLYIHGSSFIGSWWKQNFVVVHTLEILDKIFFFAIFWYFVDGL